MAVCEGFLDDEGVAGVVLKRVGESGGFSCTLGSVEVSNGLNDLA